MKTIAISIRKNQSLNDRDEYDVITIESKIVNQSIIGKGTEELKKLLKDTIMGFINDEDFFREATDEDIDYCISELAKGHASNIKGEDFWWEETALLCREQSNEDVSNETIDKISWYLSARHNLFHADMIQRAMFDDAISQADFIEGVTDIVTIEGCDEKTGTKCADEYTPAVFKNV